uniref:Putative tick transposon n=1 Tax=Ixodes ricinus TaxID=34613 RepID=A0A147BQE9_IXORI
MERFRSCVFLLQVLTLDPTSGRADATIHTTEDCTDFCPLGDMPTAEIPTQFLDFTVNNVWQQLQASHDHHKYKKGWQCGTSPGFGADMERFRSCVFLLQVSSLQHNVTCRSSDPFLMSVPCPTPSKRVLHVLCFLRHVISEVVLAVIRGHLLTSGDIELNPGPFTAEQELQIVEALTSFPKLVQGQSALLGELKRIQESLENKLDALSTRISKLESDSVLLNQLQCDVQNANAVATNLTAHFEQIAIQQDNLENQSRRNNLLFYGFEDNQSETWAESEESVIALCRENLGCSLESADIERAHRLGRFKPTTKRPIIVKFSAFKTKQSVLMAAYKLKGTRLSIGEDFSARVCTERKQLIEYAKSENAKFKLRYNKLIIGNKTFVYDHADQCVKEYGI